MSTNETEQIFLLNVSENQLSSSSQRTLVELTGASGNDLENVEDFSQVCRTCASVTEFQIPMFEGEGLQNKLADKINEHLPIQVSATDALPAALCVACANTLLAWHELATCARRADAVLRRRAAQLDVARQKQNETQNENCKDRGNTEQKECKPCRRSYDNVGDGTTKDDTNHEYQLQITNDSDDGHNFSGTLSDDDEPLSTLATKKTNLYKDFYTALVNFRNHFVAEHRSRLNYPDFTDSSDSEVKSEIGDFDDANVQGYDDLTQSNMRQDRMDDATRLELSQVQLKINGKWYYGCKICGKNLTSAHTYVFHKRIHTGERPCVCHVCGKQFRAPNGLRRHLTETHEKLRRHSCRLCQKNFANSQNLKQHMRIHTGERPFVCPQCGKRFTQNGSLHVHLKTHSEQFPYHCSECGAKFRLRSGLARHSLKHTGERPHVCVQCGKTFRQKHELNSHSLSHSDAKPFACGTCGASFRQRRALRHHHKRLHEPTTDASALLSRGSNMLIYTNIAQYQ